MEPARPARHQPRPTRGRGTRCTGRVQEAQHALDTCGPGRFVVAGAFGFQVLQRPAPGLQRVARGASALQGARALTRAHVQPNAGRRQRDARAAHLLDDGIAAHPHRRRHHKAGAEGGRVPQQQPHRHQAAEAEPAHGSALVPGKCAKARGDRELDLFHQAAAVARCAATLACSAVVEGPGRVVQAARVGAGNTHHDRLCHSSRQHPHPANQMRRCKSTLLQRSM